MPAIEIETLLILFLAGTGAGFVDAIAGGGGLIALPVLLSVGLPPQLALGTNKFQGTFGTLSSSWNFIQKGQVDIGQAVLGISYTAVGAAAGTWTVQQIDPGFLNHLVAVLLLLVLLYTLFSPNLGTKDQHPKISRHAFYLIFGLGLGYYDGFFGPGAGSFWMAAYCMFQGMHLTRSAGNTRVMNFTSNIVSLCVFILGGNVYFEAGAVMAVGQFIGARLGSSLAIRKGAGFIRPFFLAVVGATIVRLAYVTYFA
jgi:uncharacterized membrane protein YfcA